MNDEAQIRTLIEQWAAAIGLRKERGRWIVQHEHHSFTDKS
jgi:hypothetical protein